MADQPWSGLRPSRARSSVPSRPEPPPGSSSAGSLRGPACLNESMSHASTGEHVIPSIWMPGRAPTGMVQHRPGWKRDVHWDNSPCSMLSLDQEMTMLESIITRTVSGHRSQEIIETPVKSIKRKRSESDGSGWVHPLKLLVRKGLTQSDVGELGRIIIPKKDAEKQAFPQIDTKEGTVLEMEDYNASKRWCFRFKYWINNKSRMYVLENTGDFIKFHDLKEHDIFVVYEDGCKNLVVCGQKKSSSRNSDTSTELSNGETSAMETPLIITEDVNQMQIRNNIVVDWYIATAKG